MSVKKLDGIWDEENGHFRVGEISLLKEKEKVVIDNPLKQIPLTKEVRFLPANFPQEKIIFKQSSQFQQLITDKNMYIEDDNTLYHLLAQINYLEDIEKKVNDWIIQPNKRKIYVEKIRQSIQLSGIEDWFNSHYKIYRGYSIITEENGIVVNKSSDRILIADNKTVIIDYKSEKPHSSHEKQLRQYADLLKRKMSCSNIEMYLWYVEMNQVKKIQFYRE